MKTLTISRPASGLHGAKVPPAQPTLISSLWQKHTKPNWRRWTQESPVDF